MSDKTKKKVIWTIVAIVVAIAAAISFLLGTRTSQTNLSAERPAGKLGELAISEMPQFFTIRPGLTFKIDTGSDASFITEEDLKTLDSLGFKATKSFYPLMSRDGIGDTRFTTERYTVSLPLYTWTSERDSLGNLQQSCNYDSFNILHNVDFQKSETGFSTLGIDFLEKFKIIYLNRKKLLAIYFEDPMGFEVCAQMHTKLSISQYFSPGMRYYVDIAVDNDTNEYFLDTGVQRAFVKRPKNEHADYPDKSHNDSVESLRGKYPAIKDSAWVKIGNREGETIVYFYDNDEEKYALNPFNMFDLDIMLDFPNKQVKFRKS
jgi:hypothetical protein